MRTCYTGAVSKEHLDQVVTLFGWAHRRRDHGGVIFIDLRDREGLAQIVCDRHAATLRTGLTTVNRQRAANFERRR